jgi:hypothetical protein
LIDNFKIPQSFKYLNSNEEKRFYKDLLIS